MCVDIDLIPALTNNVNAVIENRKINIVKHVTGKS